SWGNDGVVRERVFRLVGRGQIWDADAGALTLAAERDSFTNTREFHTWNRAQAIECISIEPNDMGLVRIFQCGQRQQKYQDEIRIESAIGAEKAEEGACQQAGRDHQHQSQRNLTGEKHIAQAWSYRTCAAANGAFVNGMREALTRSRKRGRHAKENSRN